MIAAALLAVVLAGVLVVLVMAWQAGSAHNDPRNQYGPNGEEEHGDR